MSVKAVFLRRLRDRFYDYLVSGPLKAWSVSDAYDFAEAVIKENKEKIDSYLKEKKVTLSNINQVIDDIIRSILVPSIEIK